MKKRLVLVLLVFGISTSKMNMANAAAAGEPCTKPGATAISQDRYEMVACLDDGTNNLTWTELARSTSQPAGALDSAANDKTLSSSHWQGGYFGGNAGIALTTNSFQSAGVGDVGLHGYDSTVGLVGGYNWVEKGGFFYGGEADVNYIDKVEHSTSYVNDGTITSSWDDYATIRGRVGVALNPALLFFTGGLALVGATDQWQTPGFNNKPYGFKDSSIRAGWVVGGGAEFSVSDQVSIGIQYFALDTPWQSQSAYDYTGGQDKFQFNDFASIVRVGANWHFD